MLIFARSHRFGKEIIILLINYQSSIYRMDSTGQYENLQVDPRAYRFFPNRQEEKINFNKPNGSRILFYGQIEHDDFEKKKLAEFIQYLKVKQQNKYDHTYFTNALLLLFLYSANYKNEEAYKNMNSHIQFRSKFVKNEKGERIIQYQTDEKVKRLVDNGFFYVCGRDNQFRPTIVFNIAKADLKDTDAILRTIIFVQEEIIENMFLPGQVQCWNVVYDLAGKGLSDLPVNALKSTIQVISANYSGRLYRLWILNAPSTVYFSWKVAKNFVDPVTVQKINIIKKNTDDSLWKIYDKSQIEEKYGGTQVNRTRFFPLKVPKAVVDQSRLVSEQKYAQMFQSGVLKNNRIDPEYLRRQKEKEEKRLAESEAKKEEQRKEKEINIDKQEAKVEQKAEQKEISISKQEEEIRVEQQTTQNAEEKQKDEGTNS